MSEFTKTAIYSTLIGDSALVALLGTDENSAPAIFNAAMNQKQRDLETPGNSWTYDCITFREAAGNADPRFTSGAHGTEFFDFEVWSKATSSLNRARIAARLDALFHNVALTVSSGKVYWMERVTQVPDQYDEKLKVHFGLYRYRLIVGN